MAGARARARARSRRPGSRGMEPPSKRLRMRSANLEAAPTLPRAPLYGLFSSNCDVLCWEQIGPKCGRPKRPAPEADPGRSQPSPAPPCLEPRTPGGAHAWACAAAPPGERGGACPQFCGKGNACCRFGSTQDPAECRGILDWGSKVVACRARHAAWPRTSARMEDNVVQQRNSFRLTIARQVPRR